MRTLEQAQYHKKSGLPDCHQMLFEAHKTPLLLKSIPFKPSMSNFINILKQSIKESPICFKNNLTSTKSYINIITKKLRTNFMSSKKRPFNSKKSFSKMIMSNTCKVNLKYWGKKLLFTKTHMKNSKNKINNLRRLLTYTKTMLISWRTMWRTESRKLNC